MFLTSYLRRHYFDAVVIHAVWLSKYFDVFPLSTIKILATHDQVSQRAAQPTGPHLVTVEGGFVENYVCSEKDTIISLDRAQLIITHNSNYTQWIRRQSKCVDVINFPGRLSERSFTPASIDYRSRNKVVFGFVGDSRLVGFKCLNEFLSLLKKRLLRDPIPIEVLITGEICSHIDTKNFGFVRLVFSETNPQEFWQSIDFIVSLNERAPELDLSVVTAIDVQIPVLSTVHSVVGCALPDDLLVNSLPLLVDRVVDITIQRPDYSRFLELIALSKRNTFALYRDSTQDLSNAIIKKTNSFVLDYPE